MKMRKQIALVLIGFVGVTFAKAQVTPFNPGVASDGVNYILPKTAIDVDVQAMQIVYTPGEYSKYAERYLRLRGVSGESDIRWEYQGLSVRQSGIPDTLKRYSVKAKDKNWLPKMQLDDSGIMLSVNKAVTSEKVESDVVPATNNRLDYTKYLTEEMLAATSTSKLAELVAAEILDIRENMNLIIKGQAEAMPKDGESLRVVLDELKLHEKALLQLFVGYTDTTYYTKSYRVVPVADVDKDVLFRFSSLLGFVDADDYSGAPYYISIKDAHTVTFPSEKDAAKKKITGLVYNIPSSADVKIYTSSKVVYENSLPFAQFGIVDMLSPTLFGRDVTTKVVFDPATGGISSIE